MANELYQVVDWDDHYENNKSRERDECSYVCMPNKQDGMGLTYILNEEDGASIYGIWCLVVGAVSRQRRMNEYGGHDKDGTPATKLRREGYLTDDGLPDGRPWSARDLALRWRRREKEVQRALDFLCEPNVGWMRNLGESARQVPAKCPPSAPEGKGREGNRREEKERPARDAGELSGFAKFWSAWPKHERKQGKSKCGRLWERMKLEPITEQVIASLERCKVSQGWLKKGGQFIPLPMSWLNDTPWETDPAEMVGEPSLESDASPGFERAEVTADILALALGGDA